MATTDIIYLNSVKGREKVGTLSEMEEVTSVARREWPSEGPFPSYIEKHPNKIYHSALNGAAWLHRKGFFTTLNFVDCIILYAEMSTFISVG